jgi:crotonobetainyl-CoA:carnitine CoA-transferase CaiB-like acyl-CoA transferase
MNKRQVFLDLKSEYDQQAAKKLIATCDVFVENFRPGLLAALDLSLDDLRRANHRLVTCSLTAFGADAPETGARPGYDIIMQALTGLMSVTGEEHRGPVKVGVALLDVIAGLYASIGILAAVQERERTGRGRHVSVALFDAGVAAMVNQAANHLIGGVVAAPMGTAHPNICPYQAFPAADRSFILAAGNDRLFRRTCEVIGEPALADDARFATNDERVRHRAVLIPMLEARFGTRPAAEWLDALEAASVPCAPVRTFDEVFEAPEGASTVEEILDPRRGTILRLVRSPIRVDGEPLPVGRPPPVLGEHTAEVLGRQ